MIVYEDSSLVSDLDKVYRMAPSQRPAALNAIIEKVDRTYSKAQFISDMKRLNWRQARDRFSRFQVQKSLLILIGDGAKEWNHGRLEWTNKLGQEYRNDIVKWAGLTGCYHRAIFEGTTFLLFPPWGAVGAALWGVAATCAYSAWSCLNVFDIDVQRHKPNLPC